MIRPPQGNNLMERLELAQKIIDLVSPAASTRPSYNQDICSLANLVHFNGLNKPFLYAEDVANAIDRVMNPPNSSDVFGASIASESLFRSAKSQSELLFAAKTALNECEAISPKHAHLAFDRAVDRLRKAIKECEQ